MGCELTRESLRKVLFEFLEAASKLEGLHVSQLIPEVLKEVMEVVEEVEKERVDWFDNVIRRILKAKDHQKFAQKVTSTRECMEALQKQLDFGDRIKKGRS